MNKKIVSLMVGLAALSVAQAHAQDAATLQRGKQVFDHWCDACHGPGRDRPGTNALKIKYNGTRPPLLEERTDLPADAVKTFVRNGIFTMAPFRKTEISDDDLNALAAYIARKKR